MKQISAFSRWLALSPFGSLLKVFLSAMLAQYIAEGKSVFDITSDGWKNIIAAGVAAFVLVLYNMLNPNDPRYGYKKTLPSQDKIESDATDRS